MTVELIGDLGGILSIASAESERARRFRRALFGTGGCGAPQPDYLNNIK
jgi:hypothetical protein